MGKKQDADENARRKAAKRAQKQQKQQRARPETTASARATLKRLGLRVKSVEPDGNCQFRAIADQLYGAPDRYREVRALAIAELEKGAELYSGFVTDDEPWTDYVARMRDESEWGDNLTLMALAAAAALRVIVHQNDATLPRYELVAHHGAVRRTVHVLFDGGLEHYDSVRALGDGADDGEAPAPIVWAGGEGAAEEGGSDGEVDALGRALRDGARLDEPAGAKARGGGGGGGGASGGSARDKRVPKTARTKKALQAEALAEAAAEARRAELAKTLSV
jgi:hypothetical protein